MQVFVLSKQVGTGPQLDETGGILECTLHLSFDGLVVSGLGQQRRNYALTGLHPLTGYGRPTGEDLLHEV